jgi:hypothetical protein
MIIGAGAEHVSPAFVAELRRFFGLDLPCYKQIVALSRTSTVR